MSLLADTIISVTDLETLVHLARRSPTGGLLSNNEFSPRRLGITLRQPIQFFKSFDNMVTNSSVRAPTPNLPASSQESNTNESQEIKELMLWNEVWPALFSKLQELQSVRLWLDHDQSSSWVVVDERASLSPLINTISSDQRVISGDLYISANLPFLHPRWETPDRHFTEGNPAPACLAIERRLRQRYHTDVDGVKYEEDFPVMLELFEFSPDFEDMTFEEMVAEERTLWQRGVDVNQLVAEVVECAMGATCTFPEI